MCNYGRLTVLFDRFSGCVHGGSFGYLALSGLSVELVEVLLVVEILLWVLDLSCQFLDWFCDSSLESRFKEEEECDEDEDVEEEQDDLEPHQVAFYVFIQSGIDVVFQRTLLPTDHVHFVLLSVVSMFCDVV